MKILLFVFNLIAFWASFSILHVNADIVGMSVSWSVLCILLLFLNAVIFGSFLLIKKLF